MTVKAPDFIGPRDLVPERDGDERRPDDAHWQESSTLPQRAVKLILEAGITYYGQQAGQKAIRRALPFLEAKELAIIETLIVQQPLKVIHGFPKINATMPVLAIVLGSERGANGERYLDDYASSGEDTYGDAGGGSINVHSVGFDTILRLMVFTENADITILWYELTKYILIQSRRLLAGLGIDIPVLNGKDLVEASRDEAELLYLRELQLSFRTRQVFAEEAGLITFLGLFIKESLTRQRALIDGIDVTVSVGAAEPPAAPAEPEPEPSDLDDWFNRPRLAAGNAPDNGTVGIRQTSDGPAAYVYDATLRDWVRNVWAAKAGTVTLLGVVEGNKDTDLESPGFTKSELSGGTVDPVSGYVEINSSGPSSRASLSADPAANATIVAWMGYIEVTDPGYTGATVRETACHINAHLTTGANPLVLLNFAHEDDDLAVLIDSSNTPYAGRLGTNERRNLQRTLRWVELYVTSDATDFIELYIDHVLVQRLAVADLTEVAVGNVGRIGDFSAASQRRHRLRQVTEAVLATT